jgi:catechol 2,3-dioxygenase-like lactoylglutathione lyase family enzyme
MITGCHHVSFTVSSLPATQQFFEDVLGFQRIAGGRYDFPYIARTVGHEGAVLDIALMALNAVPQRGELMIELIEYIHPRCDATNTSTCRPGSAHLCLLVDDIHSEYERMRSLGVEFISSPNAVTFGKNNGASVVYFTGPDDIRLELMQRASA